MSWSYSGQGKPSEVRLAARKAMQNQKCSEPEESIKHLVLNVLEKALNAYPDGQDVSVSASGSQSKSDDSPARATNSLKIEIRPLAKE